MVQAYRGAKNGCVRSDQEAKERSRIHGRCNFPRRFGEIVDVGRLAATGRNRQPWDFIVITDKEMI